MALRYEAWTLPWSTTFERVIADIPVVIGTGVGTVRLNDVAGGSIGVPNAYARLTDLITTTAGRLIRVYDSTTIVHEFLADRVVFSLDSEGWSTVLGDDLMTMFDRAVTYPYDYEGSPSTFPNHVWGGPNVLDNPGFELQAVAPQTHAVFMGPEEYNVNVGASTTGNFTLTVDGQTTANIAWDATASTVATRLEALSNVTDVDVTGTGSTSDPWNILFQNPHLIAAGQMTGTDVSLDGVLTVTNVLDPALTFTLTSEAQTTASINWNDNSTVVNDRLEALSTITDVLVQGVGSPADPWRVEYVTPKFPAAGMLTGTGVGLTVDLLQDGSDEITQVWTKSQRADARTTPAFHGEYTIFRQSSGAEPVRTGSYAQVVAGTQYAGLQQIVQVEEGGTYQPSIFIRTNAASQTFRLVIRDRYEAWIGQAEITPAADTYTQASIIDLVIPAGVTEVVFRAANIEATPTGIWYFDDAALNEGLAAANMGVILTALLDDAISDHSGDTRGVILDWVDITGWDSTNDSSTTAWPDTESFTAFRGASYGQTFDRITAMNYERKLTPKASPTTVTHDLDWFATGKLGTDHTSLDTPAINIGQSIIKGKVIRRIPHQTAVLVEGAEGAYYEQKDSTAETNFGRMEKYKGDIGITSTTSLTALAQKLLDQEAAVRDTIDIRVIASPDHPRPLVDYLVGDKINVQLPPIIAKTAKRVSRITYKNTEPVQYDITFVEPPP